MLHKLAVLFDLSFPSHIPRDLCTQDYAKDQCHLHHWSSKQRTYRILFDRMCKSLATNTVAACEIRLVLLMLQLCANLVRGK